MGCHAHHLAVLHLFLQRVIDLEDWDDHYAAHHRLGNYEQCLRIMGKVFKLGDVDWISSLLTLEQTTAISDTDIVIAGLKQFAASLDAEQRSRRYGVSDITRWAMGQLEFGDQEILTNPWRLAKYIKSHRLTLEKTCGMLQHGTMNNKAVYRFITGQ